MEYRWDRSGWYRRTLRRAFEHDSARHEVRDSRPAGEDPRIGVIGSVNVRLCGRPPFLVKARLVRKRKAEEVFDLRERQDHGACVSFSRYL